MSFNHVSCYAAHNDDMCGIMGDADEIYLTIIATFLCLVKPAPTRICGLTRHTDIRACIRINSLRENHCVARSVFTMFTQPPHMLVRYILCPVLRRAAPFLMYICMYVCMYVCTYDISQLCRSQIHAIIILVRNGNLH